MTTIRAERAGEADAIRALHDAAFGQPGEGRLVDALRQRQDLYIGLAAVENGVVGHIVFSPATLHCYNAPYRIVGLGPMAVVPARQREGIGSALVKEGLQECRRRGHDIVVVLGHPEYYRRFGFVPARARGIMTEYAVPDEAFMVAELTPGALRNRGGVVYYASEFNLVAPTTTRISAW